MIQEILFIAANGKRGSAILHNALGQIDGFRGVAELRHIWKGDTIKNRLCGCGVPFRESGLSQDVMDRAFGGLESVGADEMRDVAESFRIRDVVRTRSTASVAEEGSAVGVIPALDGLYNAIREVSGSRVVVDSLKTPLFGNLLRYPSCADVHYVRFICHDPAIAYSSGKKRQCEPGLCVPRDRQSRARSNGARRTSPRGSSSPGGETGSWPRDTTSSSPNLATDTVGAIVGWLGDWPADLTFRSS